MRINWLFCEQPNLTHLFTLFIGIHRFCGCCTFSTGCRRGSLLLIVLNITAYIGGFLLWYAYCIIRSLAYVTHGTIANSSCRLIGAIAHLKCCSAQTGKDIVTMCTTLAALRCSWTTRLSAKTRLQANGRLIGADKAIFAVIQFFPVACGLCVYASKSKYNITCIFMRSLSIFLWFHETHRQNTNRTKSNLCRPLDCAGTHRNRLELELRPRSTATTLRSSK